MDTELKNLLKSLALKYENKEFLIGDPSWFMHQVERDSDKELLAFIASSLSYGSRKQFLPKIQYILDESKGKVKDWLCSNEYIQSVPDTNNCYYRLYTYSSMQHFLTALKQMIEEYGSMKNFVIAQNSNDALDIIKALTHWFLSNGSSGIIPKDASSSCKRVCMFLRWMVRDNSPVDLGLWQGIIDKRTLIIPMDTHVVQEANRLRLTNSHSTSMSSALKLTNKLKEIFPDDPVKGDFALFGIGIDS